MVGEAQTAQRRPCYHELELTKSIIRAAIEVHRQPGPGLLESTYQVCLARELALGGLSFEQEKALPITYRGVRLDAGLRLDFIVEGKVVVELKAVESLNELHEAQLLIYLKLTGCKVGLLINFNVPVLKQSIRRMIL